MRFFIFLINEYWIGRICTITKHYSIGNKDRPNLVEPGSSRSDRKARITSNIKYLCTMYTLLWWPSLTMNICRLKTRDTIGHSPAGQFPPHLDIPPGVKAKIWKLALTHTHDPNLTVPRLGVLTITEARRGVLTLTVILTDPRVGNYLKTGAITGRWGGENWH